MRRLSFEDAFTWAVFVISLVLLAAPFFTGEQSISSLLSNKLALIGAAALILLFFYKLRTLRQVPTASQAAVKDATDDPGQPPSAANEDRGDMRKSS
jgi:hypothetical protein